MTTARAATLQETLRLRKLPPNGLGWHRELRRGLPYGSLTAVAKTLKLSEKELWQWIGLSPQAAAARKKARRLGYMESDLLYALARAYVRLASFKTTDEARTWLASKIEALKAEIPLELLHTRLGTEYVMSIIERERAQVMHKLLDARQEMLSETEEETEESE